MVDLGARTVVLVLLLGLCLSAGLPAGELAPAETAETAETAEDGEYILIPVSIMIVPSFSLPPAQRRRTVSVVALNLGVGYTDRLTGVGAGIVNLVGQDSTGAMAGVGNYVGGDLTGVQSGVVNISAGHMRGAQSGVTNFAGSGTGAQFGLVNVAGNMRGLQAGLINISRELEGVPLGLINIVMRGGLTHGQVYYDELGGINAALLHGSRWVYNTYTLAVDQEQQWWSGGIGLGVHLSASPGGRSYLNIEATTSALLREGGWDDSGQVLVHRARVYAGARIAKRAALFAGASFNYAAAIDGGEPDLPTVLHGFEFPFSSARHRFWPGLFAGLEF